MCSVMNKQSEFIKLVKDVSECHACENMLVVPHSMNSEYLENDNHGLDTETPYVNLWNLWHGNLDADIMVIGQDFGQKEDAPTFLKNQKSKQYTNPTDVGLRDLFKVAFNIDVDDENTSLFFTNMANCYRKHHTTGAVHPGWLPICASRYMTRLIRIIQPKVIIVLGQESFNAMYCLEGAQMECVDADKMVKNTLQDIMNHTYMLHLGDEAIGVFPVYHPGANSKRNRTTEQQIQDWKRIFEYYEKL